MNAKGTGDNGRRKLIFIRHGKAEEQVPDISDFERSLTAKGKHQCRLMAGILKSREKKLGAVISSPAFRALETALIFCSEFDVSPATVELCPDLYFELDQEDFIPFIRRQDDDNQTITLFGHNPLITEMASFFAADEPEALPKTGIFTVSFDAAHWSDVEPGSGATEYFLIPRFLL